MHKQGTRPARSRQSAAALLVLVLCLLGLSSRVTAQEQKPRSIKRILALFPYQKDALVSGTFDQTFQQAFRVSGNQSIDYYAEYLEPYRFPDEPHALLMRDYLQKKYANRSMDVVVAVTDKALEFLMTYREELFAGVPIVYFADRPPSPISGLDAEKFVGVLNADVYRRTIRAARDLEPARQKVLVVVGSPGATKTLEAIVRSQLVEFTELEFEYLADLPMEEVLRKTSSASQNSLILYVRQTTDESGKNLVPLEGLERIAKSANVPIYSVADSFVGHGIVGGYVISLQEMATQVAELTLRVVNGTRPQDIPVTQGRMSPMFDYRQLERWGIPESKLPSGSVVRFKEPTFWQQYKWRILVVITLLLLQTLLIVKLLVERGRRWRATRGLSESEARYRNVVQTQTELICRYLPDTTLTFVNDAYCRYFGKSRAELIGARFLDLIPEHARSAALMHIQSLVENPRIENDERETVLSDGSIRWQQWVNHVIVNGNGRVKELQGIGRDITERKLAEQALAISEEKFVKAFRANPQPMSVTTLQEGRYLDINESFLQMSGYTRPEVIGRTPLELGILETYEEREKLIGPLRENKSVRNFETKFRTKAGDFRILLSSAERVDLNGQECVLEASSDITDRKRLEEERAHAENELSQLTARLFSLQDEERRRIARELHDGTAQNLFAISIDLDHLRKQSEGNSDFKSLLDESASLCEQSLQEIRTLSYLLHPPLLDEAGLVSALKWYVAGFIKRSGISVNLIVLEDIDRMGAEIETTLFRIVQESLTNIRRHSRSETAIIRLRRNHSEVLLEIEDHGQGMKVADRFGPTEGSYEFGVGIPGMRQRLRQLGGRLEISSGPGATIVIAAIPLPEVPANGTGPQT